MKCLWLSWMYKIYLFLSMMLFHSSSFGLGIPEPWQTPTWAEHPNARQLGGNWVIYKESLSPQTKGSVVFFVPETSMHNTLNACLRLNEAGYDTLVVAPSLPEHQPLAQYGSALATQWLAMATAVINQRPTQDGRVILLFGGVQAFWGIEALSKETLPKPYTLFLYDSFYPVDTLQKQLLEQLATLEYPILDLYMSTNNAWIAKGARERRWSMQRAGALSYQSFELNHPANLAGRMYGWLMWLDQAQ